MEDRALKLQQAILTECVGHDFAVIMGALTMVAGGMIGQFAQSAEQAESMVQAAAGGIRLTVQMRFPPSEVH